MDAIDPDTLRGLVRGVIRRHVDDAEIERLALVEQAERQSLKNLAEVVKDGDDGTVWTFHATS